MWCAPPAWIQAAAATFRSGCGSHSARATGSFGSGWSVGTASTWLTIMRKRLPISTIDAFSAGPVCESNTSRTGSALPPMPSGWISSAGLPTAIEGQISSMCAPSTFMPDAFR